MDSYKLIREDAMVFLGGILLVIGLVAFPWYTVSVGLGFSVDLVATDSPYAVWGVLALIATILLILDLAAARFRPAVQIPTTQFGRDMTRVGLCAIMLICLFVKFLDHVGDFGWGFYIDVILALVVAAGTWLIAQGKATPITMPSGQA